MNNLNGSEKQIAWATDIRKEFIEKTQADMKSADKNDVLDMKAMLKVADNITEAADWINARRNVKIMFFNRADFWEARREIKAAEKPAEKEDSGRKPSVRDMLKAKNRRKERCRRFRPDGRRAAHRLRPLGLGLLLQACGGPTDLSAFHGR